MLDLAGHPNPTARGEKKLERAARLAALSSNDLTVKYRELLASAVEACPVLPASRCERLVGFYFTAGLAATQMTPGWREEIELSRSHDAVGARTIIYMRTNTLPEELSFPHSPQFRPTQPLNTEFSQPRPDLMGAWSAHLARYTLGSYPDLVIGTDIPRVSLSMPVRRLNRPAKPDPFSAFSELKTWLHLTSKQLTELLGIKRTTPNAWKREGRTPRMETEMRLMRLHRYVGELAQRPDASDQLARIRPALPALTRAIYAEAAISSETLSAAGIEMPLNWRKLNAFQASSEIRIDAHEDGTPLVRGAKVQGTVVREDEDELDLLY